MVHEHFIGDRFKIRTAPKMVMRDATEQMQKEPETTERVRLPVESQKPWKEMSSWLSQTPPKA